MSATILPSGRHLIADEWLARVLQREVYRIVVDDSWGQRGGALVGLPEAIRALDAGDLFIYAKVPTTLVAACKALESWGFNLVDTNLVFDKRLLPPAGPAEHSTVRWAVPEDELQVAELAASSFQYSRFHLDGAFPGAVANTVKAEWVKNFFAGKRGDQMVIAAEDGSIAGFLLLLQGGDGTRVIDLIAVDAQHRRKGIAGRMIAYAESRCRADSRLLVGTQVANLPSIRLYQKLGFTVCASQYVFHYHRRVGESV